MTKKNQRKEPEHWKHHLPIVLATGLLLWVFMTGCTPHPGKLKTSPAEAQFIISQYELDDQNFTVDADSGPKGLIIQGTRAWLNRSHETSGDLFLAAYNGGKDRNWEWKTDAKIRLLGHALRAYHLAGTVGKEKAVAKYLAEELSPMERMLLPKTCKILIYWATSDETDPIFSSEIPSSLKIANFVQ